MPLPDLPAITVDQLWAALNATRIYRGISWRTLAKEAGTSPSTVSRMPIKSPSMESFLKLIEWLAANGEVTGCPHDGAIMMGGIGTLENPPEVKYTCLQCGAEISPDLLRHKEPSATVD